MKFMGLALADHSHYSFYEYFLNSSNHSPNTVPIDYFSFHFYANADRTNETSFLHFFTQADKFIADVDKILEIRNELCPDVKIDVDELGNVIVGS